MYVLNFSGVLYHLKKKKGHVVLHILWSLGKYLCLEFLNDNELMYGLEPEQY